MVILPEAVDDMLPAGPDVLFHQTAGLGHVPALQSLKEHPVFLGRLLEPAFPQVFGTVFEIDLL
jgi:hypothetical protein